MKSLILYRLLVALITAAPLVYAGNIDFVGDEWCPYNCKAHSESPGYMIEIGKKVFERQGYKVDYYTIPWARAVAIARSTNSTALVAVGPTDFSDFLLSSPLGISTNAFYVKANSSWRYKDLDSLKIITLGIIRGYGYGLIIDQYLSKNESKPRVVIAASKHGLNQNIKMLLSERIDVLIANTQVMSRHLSALPTMNAENIKEAGRLAGETMHFAFSRNDENSHLYIKWLNDGVKQLRISGELKLILEKYGVEDWGK